MNAYKKITPADWQRVVEKGERKSPERWSYADYH